MNEMPDTRSAGFRNKTALNKFIKSHEGAPLADLVKAVHIKLNLAMFADNSAHHHRLDAGRMLVELRTRVEAEGHDWWKWQDGKFGRSRKGMEKLMRMARADEPEAAIEEHRAKDARQHRTARAARDGADVGSKQLRQVVVVTDTPCDDCNTDHERWQRSVMNMAGESVSLPAYWTKQFGDWKSFPV